MLDQFQDLRVLPFRFPLVVVLLYPRLVDNLLATPGIGAISRRAEGQTIVLGQQGGMLVAGEGHRATVPTSKNCQRIKQI